MINNPHLQTIVAALFRPFWANTRVKYRRQRILTPDDDFLDLDWYEPNKTTQKLVIILHGLEGSAEDSYVKATTKFFSKKDFNVLAMNFRSCGGTMNNKLSSYHSGKTEDLDVVIESVLKNSFYQEIYLMGFSIGGNTVLKYLGEKSGNLDSRIKKAVSVSAPLDLKSSALALAGTNLLVKIYMKNLLKNLRVKIKAKMLQFPGEISDDNYHLVKNFYDFDGRYTAPLNGFKDAEDYWAKASAKPLLKNIRIPTLIYSALDDPFLGPACFPDKSLEYQNKFISLDYPEHGGHVGFLGFSFLKINNLYERVALEFFLH